MCKLLLVGAIAHVNRVFGEGSGPVILHGVMCSGRENSLANCTSDRRTPSCSHSLLGAGVTCVPGK